MIRPFPLYLLLIFLIVTACQGSDPADESAAGTPQEAWRLLGGGDAKAPLGADEAATAVSNSEGDATNERPSPIATYTLQPGAAAILVNTPRAGDKEDTTAGTPEAAATKVIGSGGGQHDEPEPTLAGTPTETRTPGPPTRTPTPTLTPTATPVPSAAGAPRFPETPVRPFDPADFRETLRLIDDSMRSFEQNWLLILTEERDRNRGDCGSFLGWFTLWVTQAPFYTDVPPEWNNLVYNYRTFLADAVYFSSPIQRQCPGMTTDIRINRDLTINFFTTVHARSTEMLQQAWGVSE